jgi:surface polysaccharide O-acyltransferase-like enzyme
MIASRSNRIAYFDFLRIFATFAIIIQHIDPYGSQEPGTAEYIARLIFDLITRCGVPLFLMISGALFLGSESSIKRIYTHNILRIVIAFAFWSALYSVIRTVIFGYGTINMVMEFFFGHYHMWFMCLIVELYILTPILRKIVNSWTIGKYFLIILLIYTSIVPMLTSLVPLVSSKLGDLLSRTLQGYIRNKFHMGVFYFVFGYYLSKCQLTVCRRRWIYAMGILGLLISGFGSHALAGIGVEDLPLLNNNCITIVAFTSAVFVFARSHCSFNGMKKWGISLILKLSKYSFGAYLVHALVIEMIDYYIGFEVFQIGPIFSILLLFLIVCVVSFSISAIINHIPFIKKYIV